MVVNKSIDNVAMKLTHLYRSPFPSRHQPSAEIKLQLRIVRSATAQLLCNLHRTFRLQYRKVGAKLPTKATTLEGMSFNN